jgi:hypothetical protein
VTATVALVLAIAGGAAYAVDKIHSRDIANNSVRSADLRNHKGVRGKDVRANSLKGQQIAEKTLQTGSIARIVGQQTSSCVPQSTPRNCIATTISVSRPSKLLVLTTGNQESLGGPAHASCRISIDGVQEPLTVNPGEGLTDNTDVTATNGFARTFLSTDPVGPGQHAVALRCVRLGGQVRINEPTIAAIAIAAG